MPKFLDKILPWRREEKETRELSFLLMLIGGIAGLGASFTLTVEKFHVLENPDAVLSCSINAALNCSVVMQTWQSSVFGFPNMILGLMGYAVVITVAIAALSGVKFPRPFLLTALGGYAFGLFFAYWLFFQSVYVIEVLCPWCLIVTVATTLVFASLLHYILKENILRLPKVYNEAARTFVDKGYHQLAVATWIFIMAALVVLKFGNSLYL